MEIRQKNSKKDNSFQKNQKNFVRSAAHENFQVGDVISVKITALGFKNTGVVEMKNGTTLFVPNTRCGEKVEVKIEKVFFGRHSDQKKKVKYALGTVIQKKMSQELLNSNGRSDFSQEKSSNFPKFDIKVGQKFKATIQKKGPKNSGFLQVSNNFLILVPNAKVGEKVVFEIQKIKQNYAIAKIVEFENQASHVFISAGVKNMQNFSNSENGNIDSSKNEMLGQEFHIDIPTSAKTFGNFFVLRFQGQILFVKKGLGVQAGDRVQIQIQKSMENFAIAKIQKVSPLSVEEKKYQVKETLQKMMKSSMHFGEKAIHCHANMRKFLWYRKKGFRVSPTHRSARIVLQQNLQRPMVKRGRHIFNVFKTQRCFDQALKQLAKYAAKGKTFLFVGTKKPAASLIAKTALLSHTSFFVNTRWLGGMLTNWKTILKSIAQIRPILKQKQKIQKKIFEKRQKIQRHLFQKVSLLRKKSQKFLSKGKAFIAQILNSNFRNERTQKFLEQKNAFFASNLSVGNASKNLKIQKLETFQKIQELEMAALKIVEQKKQFQGLLFQNIQKFNEFEKFLEIGQEFFKMKNALEQKNNTKFVAVSSEKFESLQELSNGIPGNSQIPNPSPELFKKMISILSNFQKGTFQSSFSSINQEVFQKSFSNRSKSIEDIQQGNSSEKNLILFSKFLKKFVAFLPFLQNAFKQFQLELVQQQKILEKFDQTLQKILSTQKTFKTIYEKTVQQFAIVCSKLVLQRKNFKAFQLNFQQFVAEQRLLKFLPKLRYFPTSEAKMYETLEFFMKKFVDPKLIYPMEQIYEQKLKFTSKKIATTRKQKWQRLEKYFGGITKMAKMNAKQISKNVAIIVGQQEEMSAVQECRKLGMKIFAIVDTNCDPKIVDHIIPANDDSRNSLHYILGEMLTYIRLGQKLRRKVSFRAKMHQMTRQKRRFGS